MLAKSQNLLFPGKAVAYPSGAPYGIPLYDKLLALLG